MAWPPVIPPATRTDATDQLTVHAADHNQTSAALTSLLGNMAWGMIGVQRWTAETAGVAGTRTTLNTSTLNVTTVAGRRYRIGFYVVGAPTTASSMIAYLFDGAVEIVQRRHMTAASAQMWIGVEEDDWQPTAGAHSLVASCLIFAGTYGTQITWGAARTYCEDVGPVVRS